ncbi:uncharacterized protein DNG_05476 [Cephalotrichum gorgonifer]|uniref:Uncharacterized protein n=1 Tax=Cephalotrichum gorgonifer TaxID=2041049 RepID=A0AAE8MXZ3_9PEZI|nr:uncharacterized protein DNG_05476 [Cephalotrichum gorgonifer]
MPRPKRARRGRQPARANAEIATDAPPAPAAASATPMKQMAPAQAAQPDSSEKENRPAPDSFLSRLGSASGPQQRRALTSATRRRDSALRNLEAEDVTTSDSLLEAWAVGDDTTELRGRDRVRRNNASGLDVDEELFTSMYSGIERPPSRGRSANTSTISAGQFMRRPRAPSVASRDGGHIRPSSRGVNTPSVSSTFNFGQFRRRAREPSILSTNRRPRRETLSDESDIELEDDFRPDAVSTPLERRQTRIAAPASSEAGVRTSGVGTRKRKSSEMEAETSGSPAGNPSRAEPGSREEEGNQDVDDNEDDVANISDDSSLSSLASPRSPLSPEADRGRPTTPINLDEIMAPPASSGSEAAEWPSIRNLAKRRRRMSPSTPLHARLADDSSDLSSPPSLTHSPNHSPTRAQTRKGGKPRAHNAKRQASPSPQTAQLTSLLPARRNRHAREDSDGPDSGDEVDVSSLGADDDELAHMPSRSRRGASRSRPQRGASARPGSRAGHPQSAAKSSRTPGSNRRVTRTYGGRNAGDDSFGPLPDDSFTASGAAEIEDPKEELKKAATKFKEVDRWELAFEEVTARSSSPLDAR